MGGAYKVWAGLNGAVGGAWRALSGGYNVWAGLNADVGGAWRTWAEPKESGWSLAGVGRPVGVVGAWPSADHAPCPLPSAPEAPGRHL